MLPAISDSAILLDFYRISVKIDLSEQRRPYETGPKRQCKNQPARLKT